MSNHELGIQPSLAVTENRAKCARILDAHPAGRRARPPRNRKGLQDAAHHSGWHDHAGEIAGAPVAGLCCLQYLRKDSDIGGFGSCYGVRKQPQQKGELARTRGGRSGPARVVRGGDRSPW
jgi:hypothetical protein